jgi:hypothetical protein
MHSLGNETQGVPLLHLLLPVLPEMATATAPAFFSSARENSDMALRIAADLTQAGANVWLDQLAIRPGQQWDREVEQALDLILQDCTIPLQLTRNHFIDFRVDYEDALNVLGEAA